MINDRDFLMVLNRIAESLEKISSSIDKMNLSRRKETDQFIKESNLRIRNEKKILNESKQKVV